MCGIAGFVSKKFSYPNLESMTECLRLRGPDAQGIFHNEAKGIGLGHRRLSIIDLSEAANQPIWSHSGRYCIIFNGEIYNFKEVAKKYAIHPKTSSDTEIIIEAFAKLGISCVNDFNGMFAIAIWDNEEDSLYLIRDRFGVKPLVYYWDGKNLAFASQLKALLQLPIEREISIEALQDYLFLEYIPGPHTILKNIYKLPVGNFMKVQKGTLEIKPYYNFLDKVESRPLQTRNEDLVMEEFADILGSSIKYRQVSDVPIGAFLSGTFAAE